MEQAMADGLLSAVFLFLPVVGLVAGPIYAPAVFAVGVLRLAWLAMRDRKSLGADGALILLAGIFIGLCWLGLAWSVALGRSFAGALQVSFVLPAALAFLAGCSTFPAQKTDRLARWMVVAFLAGMLMLLADRLDGYMMLRALDGRSVWPTKYNRGIDYFLLILLPALGFLVARRRWWLAGVLGLAAIVTVAAGVNTTARVGLPIAAAVLVLGTVAPRAAGLLLAAATTVMALGLPFALRVITRFRPDIAPHIKLSGLERLEIWDYLSAHVLQRPILGWGLWTSRLIPASPAEMAHFVKSVGQRHLPA